MDKNKFLKDIEEQLLLATNKLKDELAGIRANRPTTRLVENIPVEAYGKKMPIVQISSISIVPPREIDISVWDASLLPAIVKGLESSSLGVTANIKGNLIQINLPTLTEERKEELSRVIKEIAEEQKIRIRSLRDEWNKKVKKSEQEKTINEDELFRMKEDIQKKVEKSNEEIEKLLQQKIQEINE